MKTWKMIKDKKIKRFLHEFISEILFSSGIQSLKGEMMTEVAPTSLMHSSSAPHAQQLTSQISSRTEYLIPNDSITLLD